MKKFIYLILIILICGSYAFSQKRYFKGNTHSHCYPQSGDITDTGYTGVKIVGQYKARGYDFLVFTDHGAWWNAKVLSTPDFTVINGSEPGISGNGRWGHFTGLNMKSRISGANLTHQQLIDNVYNQGAVPFINHPRYSQIPITAAQIINDMKNNLIHQEIWNGTTYSQAGLTDISVWDSVLSTGRLIYGIACDDSHRESHQGKGWVMVYASSNNADTLVDAIRRGDFYATTDIIIDTINYSPSQIYVKSSNGETVKFYGNEGKLLSSFSSNEATYKFQGNELYVRAEITNSSGNRGWIQPYFPAKKNSIKKDESGLNEFKLFQNYPNPFNPHSVISFQLSVFSHVTLKVYDVLGKEITTLVNEEKKPGLYQVEFDGSNHTSGIYYYILKSGDYIQTEKMVLLK